EMIFVRGTPGASSLRIAQRNAIGEPWVPGGQIEEFSGLANTKSPAISEDGLTLVFEHGSPDAIQLMTSTRTDRRSPWNTPRPLPLGPDPTRTGQLTWPCLSNDGLTLWYCHGDRMLPEIRTATRSDRQASFGDHHPVMVDGKPLIGRAPRYLASTGELFLTRNLTEQPNDWSLWVVKNYQPPPAANAESGFVPLFAGNSLTGWKGNTDLWSLRDGVLTGQPTTGRSNTFLFSPRPYTDFELRFQTRIGDADNSGIQIRSEVLDAQKWSARGPQADIGNRGGDYWGGVYAEGMPGGWMLNTTSSPPVKKGDWNDYFIRCIGKRITIQVNGVTTVDGEIEPMQASGQLAFQIHRGSQQPVEFRRMEIRELGHQQAGFIPLFNGQDLTGWRVVGPAQWNVRDGAVFVDGRQPGHLVCDQQFGDFELTGEVYAEPKGNGAVCFHVSDAPPNGQLQQGGYEFQVAGSDGDPGGNYTGGLYADATPIATVRPSIVRDREWSNIRIRVAGARLEGWVNGKSTFDVQGQPERLAGRLLTLQSFAQGGEVGYRNLRVGPLTSTPETGFVPLFNGQDLAGWKTHPSQPGGWTVENGLLTGRGNAGRHLFSERGDFRDFHLRAECRTNKFGNSGIYFRGAFNLSRVLERGGHPTAYEAQILHEFPRPDFPLTGSLRDSGRSLADFKQPLCQADEWFTLEIIAQGQRLIVKVNGVETANVEDAAYTTGHIVLQARSDNATNIETVVQFRKIEVKEFTTTAQATIPADAKTFD
ncbi:MAG: hypothetical protein B7Z55_06045, partial [Planctomycetales bacterium 12-60-4]